jgi:CheY-like chemotaxis protein
MRQHLSSRILVVEDNTDLRESITEILALNRFLASGAENGKVALDELKHSQTPPALILLDLAMPVMDGVTFLHNFKQIPRLRKIPVLLMTAQEAPPALDAAAVLPKPFTPSSLLSLMKRFLT